MIYVPPVLRRQITHVIDVVASELEIEPELLRIKSRSPYLMKAKQIAQALAYEIRDASSPIVAHLFNLEDHSTVLYHYRTVAEKCAADAEYRGLVERIRSAIHAERAA